MDNHTIHRPYRYLLAETIVRVLVRQEHYDTKDYPCISHDSHPPVGRVLYRD
jgi:hypothetical protein